MKRSAEVEHGVLDTSLQRLTWNNIRDVFVILKKQGLLGPLSTAALKATYAKLLRDFQHGGSEAFRQSWTRDEWFAYFWQTLGHQMADEAGRLKVWSGFRIQFDPQKFMTEYENTLQEEWNAFPDDANFFHVFIAYLVRFLQLESVTLERNGYYMRIHYYDNTIDRYEMYNGNPEIAENLTEIIRHTSGGWLVDWNQEYFNRTFFTPWIYRALQDGWRFHDSHDIMERAPREILTQIDAPMQPMQVASLFCAQCLERDAQVQCGHQCETAFYCGQECADAHYDVHKLECVGARAGRGRGRGGKGGGRRGQDKVHKVMDEFKHHQLHSGSKNGPIVTNRKQAIAIALAEAGRSRK